MAIKSTSKKSVKKRVTKKPAPKRQTITNIPPTNGNPFRKGSSYGRIFDVLASAPGLTREDLLKNAMKAIHKDARHTGFDLSVVLSAKNNPTGKRHPSCRPGFWIEKTADGLLKLRLT